MKCARNILCRAYFKDNIDSLGFRRPYAKMRLVWANQFRADRIAASDRLSHDTLSPATVALVVHATDFAFHRKIDN
jgi:hypothetical protein